MCVCVCQPPGFGTDQLDIAKAMWRMDYSCCRFPLDERITFNPIFVFHLYKKTEYTKSIFQQTLLVTHIRIQTKRVPLNVCASGPSGACVCARAPPTHTDCVHTCVCGRVSSDAKIPSAPS